MIFGFYTAAKYRFDSIKLEQLHSRFSLKDQKVFQVRADVYDWKYYMQEVHINGLHKYALADKPEKSPEANHKKQQAA